MIQGNAGHIDNYLKELEQDINSASEKLLHIFLPGSSTIPNQIWFPGFSNHIFGYLLFFSLVT